MIIISYELHSGILFFICGYLINNQLELFNFFYNNNIALCIGDFNNLSMNRLLISLKSIMSTKCKTLLQINQRNLLDMNSHKRFIKIFQELTVIWKEYDTTVL